MRFDQLFKWLDEIIFVTEDLVEGFDVTFLVFRQLVVIGILFCDPETPGIVTQWIFDLGSFILEEELIE